VALRPSYGLAVLLGDEDEGIAVADGGFAVVEAHLVALGQE
jgi:hypothetical protein